MTIFQIFSFESNRKDRELINLIDTLAYVYAGDQDLDFEKFKQIFKTRRVCHKSFSFIVYVKKKCLTLFQVIEKMFDVINKEESELGVPLVNVMRFIADLTYFK